jgi:hypothetical protein
MSQDWLEALDRQLAASDDLVDPVAEELDEAELSSLVDLALDL